MSSKSQKPGYVRPFQNSFSRPAHYRDRLRDPTAPTLAEHDFYPPRCLKALTREGVPHPEYRRVAAKP